jgi:GWxTD domain-containing protein
MLSTLASRLLPVLVSSVLAATLPELFQKAKAEFRYGAYAESLKTLESLESESTRPGHEAERASLRPGLSFYRGANLAALGRQEEARKAFEDFLSYQPNARPDPALYPRSVIAALESARESSGRAARGAESPVLAKTYSAFPRPEPGAAEESGEDWTEGPVRHLLTSQERSEFGHLLGPLARSEFVANFWRSRDPKPETVENEFREEFEKRVAFADAQFTQDEQRGSLTDRGMVFVVLGPPTYSGRKALVTGDDTADAAGLSRYTPSEINAAGQSRGSNVDRLVRLEQVSGAGTKILDASSNWMEVWHFQRGNLPNSVPYHEVLFQFVTKQGYGKNVLQRDPSVLATLERAREAIRRGPA